MRKQLSRRTLLAGAVLTATGIDPCKAVAAADDNSGEAAAVRRLLGDQEKAWNNRDLEGFMVGYWKSEKLTFASGKDVVSGWNATLERYRKRYQQEGKEMGKLEFSDLQIEVLSPAAAWVRGRWQLKQTSETIGGLFTLILKKMADGWRIIHDHTSG